jgi:hypothetical protein
VSFVYALEVQHEMASRHIAALHCHCTANGISKTEQQQKQQHEMASRHMVLHYVPLDDVGWRRLAVCEWHLFHFDVDAWQGEERTGPGKEEIDEAEG